jgi:hypothetical protein
MDPRKLIREPQRASEGRDADPHDIRIRIKKTGSGCASRWKFRISE